MSNKEKITIKKIEWNRNGVSGEPFYSVKFTYEDDGVYDKGTKFNLIAVVFSDDIDSKYGYTRVCVISPKNISVNWRGDRFGEKIIEKIKELKVVN